MKKDLKKVGTKPTTTPLRVTRQRSKKASLVAIKPLKKGIVKVNNPTLVSSANKRKRISKKAKPRKLAKKPRGWLMLKKDDEEEEEAERAKFDELSKFKVVVCRKPQNIDEVCDNLRNTVGLLGFHFIKYDKLSREDKVKVEEAVIDMMTNFKYISIEIGKRIPKELYNNIDNKWKNALKTERKIREATLAQIIPKFTKG